VRLLAALVLPALLTLAIAVAAVRIVGGLTTPPRTHAHAIVWGTRTFASRAELGRWLESRGRSYEAWARRHPAKPRVVQTKPDGSSSRGSTTILGGAAVLAALGLAFLVRRRRRLSVRLRPRLSSSYARAHSATLLAWHDHPALVWYVGGGALVAAAALLVAGWS
jgi:MYXO-CTERM domain-containing protein